MVAKKKDLSADFISEHVSFLKDQVRILNTRIDGLMRQNEELTKTICIMSKLQPPSQTPSSEVEESPDFQANKELEKKLPQYEAHLNQILTGEDDSGEEKKENLESLDGRNEQQPGSITH